jgi:hypothetical protein
MRYVTPLGALLLFIEFFVENVLWGLWGYNVHLANHVAYILLDQQHIREHQLPHCTLCYFFVSRYSNTQ